MFQNNIWPNTKVRKRKFKIFLVRDPKSLWTVLRGHRRAG